MPSVADGQVLQPVDPTGVGNLFTLGNKIAAAVGSGDTSGRPCHETGVVHEGQPDQVGQVPVSVGDPLAVTCSAPMQGGRH